SIYRIDQRKCGSGHERKAQTVVAEQAADRRTGEKANRERRSHPAEGASPAIGRRDVRDIGIGGREQTRGRTADEAADEQPGERGGEGHKQEIETETGERDKQHRPSSKTIREQAEDRTENEAHQSATGSEHDIP